MKTYIWGPSAWKFLHAMSFAYPENPSAEHKQAVLNLFASLKYLLPCGECCAHYCSSYDSDTLKKSLGSKDEFSKWLVDFHNSVNLRLGKPIYEYNDARQYFLSEEASCELQAPQPVDEFPWKKYLSAILISLVVVLLLWLSKRKK
jgi:hypothetical protein